MPKRNEIKQVSAGDHPVFLGDGVLDALAGLVKAREGDVYVLCDRNTAAHCLPELLNTLEGLAPVSTMEVEPGEGSKSLETCRGLWDHLLLHEADRHTLLINLGGGVITDLGGFVAGTYKRGIDCVHVPTTLMGMCDAAIGGKNGIDLGGVKNAVGLVRGPLGVYVHPPFLRTLGKRELLNGAAEMLKHGLALDARHWHDLEDAPLHDLDALAGLIARSVELKAAVVSADQRESGERKKLNFGHTFGHALEAHSWESGQRELLHGEAVALGMIAEAWLSWRMKAIGRDELEAITSRLLALYKPYPLMASDHHRLLQLMRNDKKNSSGAFRCTLLQRIGSAQVDVEVSATLMSEAIDHLRHL